jgi:hypothetical protein
MAHQVDSDTATCSVVKSRWSGLERGTRSQTTSKRTLCNDAVLTALPINGFMRTTQHECPVNVDCVT